MLLRSWAARGSRLRTTLIRVLIEAELSDETNARIGSSDVEIYSFAFLLLAGLGYDPGSNGITLTALLQRP